MSRFVLEASIALARRHTISSFDATYLEVAMREGLQLATLDGALKKVAGKLKVAGFVP